MSDIISDGFDDEGLSGSWGINLESDVDDQWTGQPDPEKPEMLATPDGWPRVRLSGVTFPDDQGRNRQDAIKATPVGTRCELVRRPTNPYDANAIEVMTLDGLSLGWVPKNRNKPWADAMDAGWVPQEVRVYCVDGGFGPDPTWGIRITFPVDEE